MSTEPDTLEAEIDGLLAVAREGDEAQRRLLVLRDKVRRGVMLGPRSRRYLDGLRAMRPGEALVCQHLGRRGDCRRGIGAGFACMHGDNWTSCAAYVPARGGRRGPPLRAEVIRHAR
jgi:hypothetical protein